MTTPQPSASDGGSRTPRTRWGAANLPTVASLDQQDPVWQELTRQFDWYHRSATLARLNHQLLKLIALGLGATVTVLAAVGAPPAPTASLAAGIVVLEGIQQLFQFHANWISYRATAETLRQHAFLYAAGVAPYEVSETRRQVLAAFLRDLLSNETSAWTKTMRQPAGSSVTTTP